MLLDLGSVRGALAVTLVLLGSALKTGDERFFGGLVAVAGGEEVEQQPAENRDH